MPRVTNTKNRRTACRETERTEVRELQGATGSYRDLQGATGSDRERQGATGSYRERQAKSWEVPSSAAVRCDLKSRL